MPAQRPQAQLQFQLRLLKNIDWWEPAYIIDWIAVVLVYIARLLFVKPIPPFERQFEINDVSIKHPMAAHERVPGGLLWLLAFYVPLFFSSLVGAMKGSSHTLHHGALALTASVALTDIVVDFLKGRIGRLRPDFLARCSWDMILTTCTGPEGRVADGRRSFPSGHSALSFAGLGFVFFLLAGQLGSLRFSTPPRSRSFLGSKLMRVIITFIPLAVAAWIAITRLEDYRHHTEDVVVGSLLGFTIAFGCYIIYWPNPIQLTNSTDVIMSRPKTLYRPETNTDPRSNGFQLARTDDIDGGEDIELEEGRDAEGRPNGPPTEPQHGNEHV